MKRIIYATVISIFALICFETSVSYAYDDVAPACDSAVTLECSRPESLKPGDKVALISPSYFSKMENVEKAAEVLRSLGYEPVIGPNVGKIVDGQYAGTVAERAHDLRWALQDPSIKAIICNRGGYGSIQLIDQFLPYEFRNSPKWLVGYSDITTIHGLLNRAGVMSIHGTMGSSLGNGAADATSSLMLEMLSGTIPEYSMPAHPQNITGKATGILVGGNICTFVPNLRTNADATAGKDLILFIEEVEESMHNIDRQMRILQMSGVLDRCKGVILGEFTACGKEFVDECGQTMSVEAMIHKILEPYNIPVLCGFPAGHGSVNLPLVLGSPVTIDVRSSGATISFALEGKKRLVQLSGEAPFFEQKSIVARKISKKNIRASEIPEVFAAEKIVYNSVSVLNWKQRYPYLPKVDFAIAHNGNNVLVHYRVTEKRTIGTLEKDMGGVFRESCCELFCTEEGDSLYYNIESNCIGSILMQCGLKRSVRDIPDKKTLKKIDRWSSLGRKSVGVINGETHWELALVIPVSVFWHHSFDSLDGKTFLANVYNCVGSGDERQYVTWNPIRTDSPDFHCPEFFGRIHFGLQPER